MTEKFEIGDHVRFAKEHHTQKYDEVGVVTNITDQTDYFGRDILIIKPMTFKNDAWISSVSCYRRLQENVQKMSISEIVIFKLEQ